MDMDSDFTFTQNSKEPRNYVKFYQQWVRNNFKSQQEGIEIGDNQDFVIIISPGQPKSEVRRKATDADKSQYRHEWNAYQEGKEHQVSGTPIELLPGLPHGMADALKALYIYTIEQMATLSDIALQKVGMGGEDIRRKADAYLSKNTSEVVSLKKQLAEAQAMIDVLKERVEELESGNAEKKPRGRRKSAEKVE